MEFTKKQPALLFLDKNGFYFFEAGLPNIVTLAFLEGSIKNMDIISTISLEAQIKSFIEQYHLTPASITIILSPNITFEKDIINVHPEELPEQIKQFVDTIPFERVLSKKYTIDKGVKVIGCNEDIYQELKQSFEKNGFSVDNIIPYQFLGVDQPLIQNLTAENASQFLKRTGNLRQITMLEVEKAKGQIMKNELVGKEEAPKKNNTRLYAMGAFFIILIGILAFMLLKH